MRNAPLPPLRLWLLLLWLVHRGSVRCGCGRRRRHNGRVPRCDRSNGRGRLDGRGGALPLPPGPLLLLGKGQGGRHHSGPLPCRRLRPLRGCRLRLPGRRLPGPQPVGLRLQAEIRPLGRGLPGALVRRGEISYPPPRSPPEAVRIDQGEVYRRLGHRCRGWSILPLPLLQLPLGSPPPLSLPRPALPIGRLLPAAGPSRGGGNRIGIYPSPGTLTDLLLLLLLLLLQRRGLRPDFAPRILNRRHGSRPAEPSWKVRGGRSAHAVCRPSPRRHRSSSNVAAGPERGRMRSALVKMVA